MRRFVSLSFPENWFLKDESFRGEFLEPIDDTFCLIWDANEFEHKKHVVFHK